MEGLKIEELYKFNRHQTVLNEELKDSLPKEVWLELLDYISSVEYIKRLIAPEHIRGYAKDRPKSENYNDNRIEVDLSNPHILEDMDYFREKALYFEKHGRYTHLTPNPNPKSEYAEFWKDELRKWKDGVVRESDGEWIPGQLYFYWNYSPIWLVETVGITKDGKKKGERRRKFPKPWLGDYLFYHYMEQGRVRGQHGKLLKTRGVGFSFKMGSISPCNMYTLPGSGNPNFHLASEKTFLSGDKGIWGKVLDTLDWIAETTPLPKMRLVDDTRNMNVQLGFKDEYGTRKGIMSSVFGISLKDNPEKARGIRGPLIHYEEDGLFPNLEKAWGVNRKAVEDGDVAFGYMLAGGCLTENNFVWTKNGRNIKIIDLKQSDGIVGYNGETSSLENINWFKEPSKKECLRLTTSGGNFIECSIDHPILSTKAHYRKRINNKVVGKFIEFKRADEFKIGDQLLTIDNLNIFGDKKITDARLLGLAIGDGCYRQGQSVRIACGDSEIIEYLVNKYDCNTNDKKLQKNGKLYCNVGVRGVISIFRNAGIYGDVNEHKKLPINIHEYDKESLSKLLGGYFDADGNVYYNKKRNRIRIVLTCKYKHLLEEVKSQLVKFGIHSNIYKEFRKDGYNSNSEIHRLYITSNKDIERFKNNIPLLCKHKNDNLKKLLNHTSTDRTRLPENHKGYFKYDEKFGKGKYLKQKETLDNFRQESIIKIENVGEQFVYNLNTSITNTYLGNNFITANTGGTEGASFEGSEKLFYNCSAYNIYGIPNVFDKGATGEALCGFFWGAYMNRNGCYEEVNGEPDVIKAMIEILKDRYIVKYNSSDPNAITQKKAEEPITPQEAVMRTEGTLFPVSDLKEYLESIAAKREQFLAEHYVGELIRSASGKVEWKPNSDVYPIRSYDKDSNKTGGLEIFEMPKTNAEGEIARGRYIAGIDPIDADTGTSLFSMMVMDTFTDRIVAEYSGRPRLAEEAYEITLRVLEFYNAEANYESNLKGLFSYFDKKNALHRLADVPQILKDMDYVKSTNLYGNKAKGTHANKELNKWGRKLQADWMLSKAVGDDDDPRLNLHRLRSLAYIEECIKWNSDGNFDRVSAAGMLMILREDRYKRIKTAIENQDVKYKSVADDNFFNKNYKKQNAIKNSIIHFNT